MCIWGMALMSILISLIMLSIAVSIDSCGVGITYGLRNIKISIFSILILAICSGSVIFVAMLVGDYMKAFVPISYTKYIGASILILIGIWSFYQYLRQPKHTVHNAEKDIQQHPYVEGQLDQNTSIYTASTVLQLDLKRLGLVVQILKTPQTADVDRSGSISATEAIMLGIALSLDAFGAGIGAAFLQLPVLLTVITIMLSCSLFIGAGLWLGKKLAQFKFIRYVGILPSIILIVIGVSKLL